MDVRISPFPTAVWHVDPQHPEATIIARAASIIRKGGVVVYPTETFYGLGVDPTLDEAVLRVYRIKERSLDKPLPIIAADTRAVVELVAEWPRKAQRLADAFWPGPLTLVLSATSVLAPSIHARTGKIAIRVSSHPTARALSAAVGGLLTSTSANLSDRPASGDPRQISPDLVAQVDGFVDGGVLPGDRPSTIVDLSVSPPELLRLGCVSWERILGVLSLLQKGLGTG
jgi:L-threonylcarbamoyladenylate synthase